LTCPAIGLAARTIFISSFQYSGFEKQWLYWPTPG
jgi:hypothetical protein